MATRSGMFTTFTVQRLRYIGCNLRGGMEAGSERHQKIMKQVSDAIMAQAAHVPAITVDDSTAIFSALQAEYVIAPYKDELMDMLNSKVNMDDLDADVSLSGKSQQHWFFHNYLTENDWLSLRREGAEKHTLARVLSMAACRIRLLYPTEKVVAAICSILPWLRVVNYADLLECRDYFKRELVPFRKLYASTDLPTVYPEFPEEFRSQWPHLYSMAYTTGNPPSKPSSEFDVNDLRDLQQRAPSRSTKVGFRPLERMASLQRLPSNPAMPRSSRQLQQQHELMEYVRQGGSIPIGPPVYCPNIPPRYALADVPQATPSTVVGAPPSTVVGAVGVGTTPVTAEGSAHAGAILDTGAGEVARPGTLALVSTAGEPPKAHKDHGDAMKLVDDMLGMATSMRGEIPKPKKTPGAAAGPKSMKAKAAPGPKAMKASIAPEPKKKVAPKKKAKGGDTDKKIMKRPASAMTSKHGKPLVAYPGAAAFKAPLRYGDSTVYFGYDSGNPLWRVKPEDGSRVTHGVKLGADPETQWLKVCEWLRKYN